MTLNKNNELPNATQGPSQLHNLHQKAEFFLMKSSVTPQKPYIHTRNQRIKLIPCLHFQIFTVWSVKAAPSITKLNPTELLSKRNFIVTDILHD